jgi:hypothetical protein
MISGYRRRRGKRQRDRSADEWRSGHGEDELSGAERDDAGDDPDDDRAGTVVERGEACREARGKGKRVDGEREQQPAEKPDAEGAENKTDYDRGGGPREGRASTTSIAQATV